jgi:hypothetical protein
MHFLFPSSNARSQRFRQAFKCAFIAFVSLACWNCAEDEPPTEPSGSRFYFPTSIDYADPVLYLKSGSQSRLTPDNIATVESQIGQVREDLGGVGRVFGWIRQRFQGQAGGGATVGRTDVNDLFIDHVLRGCHDWGLLLTTLVRHFNFPAVMVDTAGISWAESYQSGQPGFYGHVFIEIYVRDRWIVVDSTAGIFAENYDPQEPVLPFTNSAESRGYYVLYKGIDPAGYGVTSPDVLRERMIEFAQALPSIELVFPNYELSRLPGIG